MAAMLPRTSVLRFCVVKRLDPCSVILLQEDFDAKSNPVCGGRFTCRRLRFIHPRRPGLDLRKLVTEQSVECERRGHRHRHERAARRSERDLCESIATELD